MKTTRKGNMDLFQLNTGDPIVISINALNDSIIMQIFPEFERTLEDLAMDLRIGPARVNEHRGPFVATTTECSADPHPMAEKIPSHLSQGRDRT